MANHEQEQSTNKICQKYNKKKKKRGFKIVYWVFLIIFNYRLAKVSINYFKKI